jgi:Tfp pilus assembly protein PilF
VAAAVGLAAAFGCAGRNASTPMPADPEHQSVAAFNLGLDALQRGDFREALQHSLRAVEFDDKNSRATYLTAEVYLSFCNGLRGFDDPDCRLADAEKFARRTVKLSPTYPDAKNLLGEVLINERRFGEAVEVLKPLTTDPSYSSIHLAWGNLGWAQVLGGDLEGGVASLKNAVTSPRFCVGFYRLGKAYVMKGDLAQADTNLSLAVDAEGCNNFQDALEERGRVRMALGQLALARADFEKCRGMTADTQAGKRCTQQLEAKP